MANSYSAVADTLKSEYDFKVEITLHEKILLTAALSDKIEERLKTAEFLKGTDTANTCFQDAGRLQRIAMVLSDTIAKDWLTLSSAT